MSKAKYASVATEDLKESSGLFDDVNARIANIQYTKEAPDGYTVEGNPIFSNVTFLLDGDAPDAERTVKQSYSLGAQAGDNFTVSDDGYGLIPSNDEAALRKDCKWGTFVSVLETAGIPKAILQAGDMSAVVGLYGHFKRVADKDRNFGDDQRTKPGQKKSKFPPSTLVCTKILALPGEKVAAGKSATSTGSSAPTPAGTSVSSAPDATSGDLDLQTMTYLQQVLGEKGGSAQRAQLTLLISKAAMKEKNRMDIAKRAIDEGFLASLVEAGVVTYDPAAKPQVVALAA